MRRSILVMIVLLGVPWPAHARTMSFDWDSQSPGPKGVKSQRFQVVGAGLVIAIREGRPTMGLDVENRSDSPLWLRVEMPGLEGQATCERIVVVEPRKDVAVLCERDTVVADTAYPMTIDVFEDSTLAEPVEHHETQMRFKAKDMEQVTELLGATRLPVDYEHVVYKKKLGLTTAMFGQLGPPSEGTLSVRQDGVTWADKKKSVTVAISQVTDVRIQIVGRRSTDAWVVVDYGEEGEARQLVLQPSAFRGWSESGATRMFASLRAMLERR